MAGVINVVSDVFIFTHLSHDIYHFLTVLCTLQLSSPSLKALKLLHSLLCQSQSCCLSLTCLSMSQILSSFYCHKVLQVTILSWLWLLSIYASESGLVRWSRTATNSSLNYDMIGQESIHLWTANNHFSVISSIPWDGIIFATVFVKDDGNGFQMSVSKMKMKKQCCCHGWTDGWHFQLACIWRIR